MIVELLRWQKNGWFAAGEAKHVNASISACRTNSLPLVERHVPFLTVSGKSEGKNKKTIVAKLSGLHDKSAVGAEAFAAHPAVADATLHLGALRKQPQGITMVPVGISALHVMINARLLQTDACGWSVTGWQHSIAVFVSALQIL